MFITADIIEGVAERLGRRNLPFTDTQVAAWQLSFSPTQLAIRSEFWLLFQQYFGNSFDLYHETTTFLARYGLAFEKPVHCRVLSHCVAMMRRDVVEVLSAGNKRLKNSDVPMFEVYQQKYFPTDNDLSEGDNRRSSSVADSSDGTERSMHEDMEECFADALWVLLHDFRLIIVEQLEVALSTFTIEECNSFFASSNDAIGSHHDVLHHRGDA